MTNEEYEHIQRVYEAKRLAKADLERPKTVQLWAAETATAALYARREVKRDWQHRVAFKTQWLNMSPPLGDLKLRRPSVRNAKRSLQGPAAAPVAHFADTSWAETPEDARKVRNARKRARKAR